MKEFEKWYNQTIRPYIHNPEYKEPLKEGWRAALERVLKERKNQGENYLKCVFDWIEQELEDERMQEAISRM